VSECFTTNLKGLKPQDFCLDHRSKRKRISHQLGITARTSFESPNYFSVLSDRDSDTESAVSTPPSPSRKEQIAPIVLYRYLNSHYQTLNALNDKLSSAVDVKSKTNRLLLYTKTEVYYEILLREIKQAQLAYRHAHYRIHISRV
jgi:hypothetical protein